MMGIHFFWIIYLLYAAITKNSEFSGVGSGVNGSSSIIDNLWLPCPQSSHRERDLLTKSFVKRL